MTEVVSEIACEFVCFNLTKVSMFNTRFLRGEELSEANYHKIKFTDLIFGELAVFGVISAFSNVVFLISDNSIRTVPKPDVNCQNTKKK